MVPLKDKRFLLSFNTTNTSLLESFIHSERLTTGNATSHSAAGERHSGGPRERRHPRAGQPELGRAGREGGLLRAGRGRVQRRRGLQVGQQRPHRPDQQVSVNKT